MDSKQCSVCKKIKTLDKFNTRKDRPSGYRSECKQCQYARQYKREKEQRHKIRAKHTANYANKKGRLQRPLFCERCKQMKPLDRHHPNYKKPVKVIWLCRKCHSEIHSSLKTA